VVDGLTSSTGTQLYSVFRDYNSDSVHIENENPGLDDNQSYGLLQDDLRNLSSQVQTITYRFKALIKDPRGDGSLVECNEGVDTTIIIYIEPAPFISVNVIPQDTICNEDMITFIVTNPNLPLGEWKYRLEIDYGEHLTGQLPADSIYTELTLPEVIFNDDTAWYEAAYKFTPIISPFGGGPDCQNNYDTTIYVRVNPTPAIRVIAADSILCNGDQAEITINNPNVFVFGDWEYDLSVIADPGMSGYRASDTALIGTSIIDPLVNNDTIVHKVAYRFTPKNAYDSLLCGGGEDTVIVIWVNPTPEIRVRTDDYVLCDGDSVTLDVRNPNFSVRGEWSYDLEITADPGIGGVVSGTVEYSSDTSFIYELTNSDQVARSVTYHFSPRTYR